MSLFTRSYLIVGVTLFLAFFLSLIVIDNNLESEDGRLFVASARGEAALMQQKMMLAGEVDVAEFVNNYSPELDVMVSARTRTDIVDYLDIERFDLNASGHAYATENWQEWWYIERLPDSSLFLLVEESDTPPASDDLLEFFIPVSMIFLALGVSFYWLARRTRRYLNDLSVTAKAIGSGQWQQRASLNVPEPILGLSRDVNSMAEQLERTFHDQQIAIGALPHEIRSPIARLRFAHGLLAAAKTESDRDSAAQRIENYLDELEETVEASLQLVRDEQQDFAQSENVSASVLADSVNKRYAEYLNGSAQVGVSVNLQNDETVHGHTQLLSQAAFNVIDNALRYADRQVKVSISTQSGGGLIVVEDDGQGIPVAQREEVLAPFFRLDPSRTRETGGVGLGLAITRKILLGHGGSVKVVSGSLGGAAFELRW